MAWRLVVAWLTLAFFWAGPAQAASLALDISVSPDQARAGQQVQIQVNLTNQGQSPARPGALTVLAGGQIVSQVKTPALKPGQSFVHRLVWPARGQGRVAVEARLQGVGRARTELSLVARPEGGPDLALSWLMAPPQGCLGQGPWTSQVGVVNKGRVPSSPGRLLFMVNARTVDQAKLPPLEPGQQLLISFTWRQALPGPNTLSAELDQEAARGDLDPTNNFIRQEFVFKKCQPDLVPVKLKLAGPVEPGRRPMRATAVIANLGGAPAEQFRVRFLIDGREIKSVSLGHIGPGQRRSVKADWMPASPGVYRLTVEVEAGPGPEEIDLTNNRRQIEFRTLHDLPDLSLSRPKIPSNICLDKAPISLKTEVTNSGRKRSPAAEVALRDGVKELARQRIDPLLPSQSRPLTFAWNPAQTGSFRLHLVVDPEDKISEVQETNNSKLLLIRILKCGPDLSLSPLSLPAEIGPEAADRRLRFTVANRGRSACPPTTVVLKLDGQEVLTRQLERLEPNQSRRITFDFPLRKAGRYRLEAVVDPQDKVGDINRGNNVYETVLPVRPPDVDLALEDISLEPDRPQAGRPLTIIAQVANRRRGVSRVKVAFKVNGREVARVTLAGLWSKATKRATCQTIAPSPGRAVVTVVVDPENRLVETDETNNSLDREFEIRP
ncbi:MAG: hypothetical protein JRJ59_02755 [Deltaproteobacteria bacterium]|nr:hypothetical protein [Deltaproteobacteria bacterium]